MGNKHIEAWISGVSYERKIKVKMKDVLLLLMNKGDKQQNMIVVGVTPTCNFMNPKKKTLELDFIEDILTEWHSHKIYSNSFLKNYRRMFLRFFSWCNNFHNISSLIFRRMTFFSFNSVRIFISVLKHINLLRRYYWSTSILT